MKTFSRAAIIYGAFSRAYGYVPFIEVKIIVNYEKQSLNSLNSQQFHQYANCVN
jgi:hypothetical protein